MSPEQDAVNEPAVPAAFSGFAERLKIAIGKEPLKAYSRRAGMSDTGIRRYFEGSLPSIDKAYQLADAAGVDFLWLCLGLGESGKNGVEEPNISGAKTSVLADDFTLVDSYAVFASAGHGSEVGHELLAEPMSFRTEWLKREGLPPERLAVIRAQGDSMEPTISDKDVILVLLTNGEPQRDGLHVIRLDGGLFVKRLQFDFNGVRVISDNPIYASRDLSKAELAELNIVGRVVWAGKKF
jgi:phage repressor protein C with HTH and peptisase S24 domain